MKNTTETTYTDGLPYYAEAATALRRAIEAEYGVRPWLDRTYVKEHSACLAYAGLDVIGDAYGWAVVPHYVNQYADVDYVEEEDILDRLAEIW